MADPEQLHVDQIAYWNGPVAKRWVARQAQNDVVLAPVAEAALAHAAPRPGERALDIGCGCGDTTLALARVVGPAGRVTALDISVPMLAVARARAAKADLENIDWLQADAASQTLPPAAFDLLFSRFGVMFFGDPVAAFANLRLALRPGGRLVFACWRPIAENAWMRVPLDAVRSLVPPQPAALPDAPGPFSFADPERVTRILAGAGWPPPRLIRLDLDLDLAAGEGLDAAVDQVTTIGPTSRALQDQPEATRRAALSAVRDALAPHAQAGQVRLGAAIWLVDCRPD
jgi:SAM-dependent methyltransferase